MVYRKNKKEEQYAGSYFDHLCDFNVGGCTTPMASQQRVGLLPERWAGNCPDHSDHLVADGSALDRRALLVPSVS